MVKPPGQKVLSSLISLLPWQLMFHVRRRPFLQYLMHNLDETTPFKWTLISHQAQRSRRETFPRTRQVRKWIEASAMPHLMVLSTLVSETSNSLSRALSKKNKSSDISRVTPYAFVFETVKPQYPLFSWQRSGKL